MPETLVVLDGNWFAYRFHFGRPQLSASGGRPVGMLYAFAELLAQLRDDPAISHWALAVDPTGPSFRHRLFAPYKAQRPPTPPDLKIQLPQLDALAAAYGIPLVCVPGYEADDVLGSLARSAVVADLDVRLATRDKDLDQLLSDRISTWDPCSGQLRGPADLLRERGIRPDQVVDWLCMVGDSADNIPGIRGVGAKGAVQLLDRFGNLDGLLERRDELTGKRSQHVEAYVDDHLLTRRLVTIETQVPGLPTIAELTVAPSDRDTLRDGLERLGIRPARFLGRHQAPRPAPITHADAAAPVWSAIAAAGTVAVAEGDGQLGLAWGPGPGREIRIDAVVDCGRQLTALAEAGVRILAADGPQLWRSLQTAVGTTPTISGCCATAAALLDERQAGDLVGLAARYTGERLAVDAGPGAQARVILATHKRLHDLLAAQGLDERYHRDELPLLPALGAMLSHGLAIDRARLAERRDHFQDLHRQLLRELQVFGGRRFDAADDDQVAALLFGRLGLPPTRRLADGPSVADADLEAIRHRHEAVDLILQERGARRMLAALAQDLPALGVRGGRCTPEWCRDRQRVTAPLLELVHGHPLGRSLRATVVAERGRRLLVGRLREPTLCLLQRVTGDASLAEAVAAPRPWAAIAAGLFQRPVAAIAPRDERRARLCFEACLDDRHPRSVARQGLGAVDETMDLMAACRQRFHSTFSWWNAHLAEAGRSGVGHSLTGRPTRLVGLGAANPALALAGRQRARRQLIDGAVGDCLKRALSHCHHHLPRHSRGLLLAAEELVVDTPEADVARCDDVLHDALAASAGADRLPVTITSGVHWSDAA